MPYDIAKFQASIHLRTVAVSYHVLFNLKIQRRFHASDAMLLVVTLRNWFFSCHHCIIVVMLHAMRLARRGLAYFSPAELDGGEATLAHLLP